MLKGFISALTLAASFGISYLILGKEGVKQYTQAGKKIVLLPLAIWVLLIIWVITLSIWLSGHANKDKVLCIVLSVGIPVGLVAAGVITRLRIRRKTRDPVDRFVRQDLTKENQKNDKEPPEAKPGKSMADLVVEKLSGALEKDELNAFLLGNGKYKFRGLNGENTDRSMLLHFGIYAYYKRHPESNIQTLFENAIVELASGTLFELMSAYDYCWNQVFNESHNAAPFRMHENCFAAVKKAVLSNAEQLKKYKEYYDFGNFYPEGAYEHIVRTDETPTLGRPVLGLSSSQYRL